MRKQAAQQKAGEGEPRISTHASQGMVFKTPVKPEWRERGMAGTMAS